MSHEVHASAERRKGRRADGPIARSMTWPGVRSEGGPKTASRPSRLPADKGRAPGVAPGARVPDGRSEVGKYPPGKSRYTPQQPWLL